MIVDDLLKKISTEFDRSATRPTFVTFRWYRGKTAAGEWEPFRYVRGGSSEKFKDLVRFRGYTEVEGPFRTKKAAASK